MAKIPSFPSQAVIDKASGILDYYVHDDQPCVRMFPRWKNKPRSEAVKDTWPIFTYVNKAARQLPANVVATWKRLALGTGLTWKDYLCRCYLAGTFNPPGYPSTFPDYDSSHRWLITSFYTTRDIFYIHLHCTTDSPTVLWAAHLTEEAHFVPVIRMLRGAPWHIDKQLVYKRYGYHGEEGAHEPSLTHHLRFYVYQVKFPGTFLVGMSSLGWPRCISQIFLEEDFPA